MSALILDMEERYGSYLQDESRMRGQGEKLAFPQNIDELQQVLGYCRERGMPVTLQGARTGIVGAAVPAGGLILNLSKMNRITGIRQEGDRFFLEAEPGVLLKELQERLAAGRFDTRGWTDGAKEALKNMQRAGRFRFIPDPTETTASIGGMFATNAKGLSGYVYGRMSDYTERITFVSACEEVWRIPRGKYMADKAGCLLPDGFLLPVLSGEGLNGRKLSGKSVPCPLIIKPGGDLMDLLAGSEGMLGVAASLELSLWKCPAECWGILFFFTKQQDAARFAGLLGKEAGAARVTAGEFFDRASMEMVERMKGQMTSLKAIPDIPADRSAAVYVTLEADRENGAEELLLDLLSLFEECGGREEDTWAASGLREMEKFRLFRHGVPEGINNRVDEIRRKIPEFVKIGADFGGSKQDFGKLLETYNQDIREAGLSAVVFGHALERRLHVNLLPAGEEEKRRAEALMERWADEKAAAGESLAAENGIGKVKAGLVHDRLAAEVLEEMRTVKRHFDRKGLLNRGNMGL